ncbi:MAG: hypothetical protein AB7I33_09935 [Gemmatimonadales bacterium]
MRALLLCGALVVATALGATPAHAQSLKLGTWTGTVIPPDGDPVAVTFDVAMTGDTLKVTMHVPEAPSFEFSKIRFEEGKLLFSWMPGPEVRCTLVPADDGSYSGDCIDDTGESGTMSMVPPEA